MPVTMLLQQELRTVQPQRAPTLPVANPRKGTTIRPARKRTDSVYLEGFNGKREWRVQKEAPGH
jgi:hypothetical protein